MESPAKEPSRAELIIIPKIRYVVVILVFSQPINNNFNRPMFCFNIYRPMFC